jgi:hypothetical protein
MTPRQHAGFRWWCAATIFLSAFLLFQVQPIISKMILPWFGGGPAVWTTCMLFFQVLLLAGYAYAHGIHTSRRSAVRTALHVGLLVLAMALLPIIPQPDWKPEDGAYPTWRILSLLSVHVGLPYFMLSTTGPLVQAWYSRVCVDRSPYRLYALSNIGSLGALLTYPFLVEPNAKTNTQGMSWSLAFAVFGVACAILAIWTYRALPAADASEKELTRHDENTAVLEAMRIPVGRRLTWLLLPALASVMLLAVTNHVCQDVAVVPFFWVVPLALYLISFIICFDRDVWYRRRLFAVLAALSIVVTSLLSLESELETFLESVIDEGPSFCLAPAEWMLDQTEAIYEEADNLAVEATSFMIMLFMICMLCHGELSRRRPPASRLTDFYLMVAAGGALGGIFVGLICPQVFSIYVELHGGIIISFLLATAVFWDAFWNSWLLRRMWRKCVVFVAGVLVLIVIIQAQFLSITSDALVTVRNFYGVLTVNEHYPGEPDHIYELLNGRILHGSQFQGTLERRIPTTYYDDESGIGTTLLNLNYGEPLRVGVVGLGTGTIAAYGSQNDYYCFYEINPNVPRLANKYFTYLRDSNADIRVILGDARISMERQSPQDYDVIALDAFSGDAIPAHLLTKEAFGEYFRHLNPEGVIAVHVSNRHLDLIPVVGGIAEHFAIPAVIIEAYDDGNTGEAGSDWILLTRNEEFLAEPMVVGLAEEVQGTYTPVPLWTDQYSNLFDILN